MTWLRAVSIATAGLLSLQSFAQDIAIGTWRTHNCYTRVVDVTLGPGKVYGATPDALVIYDMSDHSLATATRLNGLTSAGLTSLAFDNTLNELLIGYDDGTVNILQGNKVLSFTALRDANIASARTINRIKIHGNLAYLACPFGVMVLDPAKLEVRETYRDLGATGESLAVQDLDFKDDSIFLATSSGVLAGSLTQNLLDYRNWKRYDAVAPTTVIANFNNELYAGVDGSGLFRRINGAFAKQTVLSGDDFKQLTGTASVLLICSSSGLWRMDMSGNMTRILSEFVQRPQAAQLDDSGTVWAGDSIQGMSSWKGGSYAQYLPNGPAAQTAAKLRYLDAGVCALPGRDDDTLEVASYSTFDAGQWTAHTTTARYLSDVALVGSKLYFAFYGGLLEVNGSGSIIFTDKNSPLQASIDDPSKVLVSSLAVDGSNLWVANDESSSPLLRLAADGTWSAFSFPSGVINPINLIIDQAHRVWMTNGSGTGGLLVFDPSTNQSVLLSDEANHGGLPSSLVYSLAEDLNGDIWIGTSDGVGYISNGADVTSVVNAVRPIYQNHYLLQGQKVNAIVVDGGNRKWIGTNEGLWLFGPDGDNVLESFSTSNSPLPSNNIVTLALNSVTGELFIGTDRGLVSYRGSATDSAPAIDHVKIFPNPVTANFNGQVGITGLSNGAVVKITDSRGHLIWQGYSNGGTAAWNVRDYAGNRPGTGVYLVFCSTADGSDRAVGKIAIIN